MIKRDCIICETAKDDSEFGKEHIFPDAHLKNIQNNNLITYSVCTKCNNDLGLFVDSPVAKYWFINHLQSQAIIKYGDLTKDTLSFLFIGNIQNFTLDNFVCDKWGTFNNSTVYHFRPVYTYKGKLENVQGIHPIHKIRKEDRGVAILIAKNKNPKWQKFLIRSFSKQFKNSKRYIYYAQGSFVSNLSSPPKKYLKAINQLGQIKSTFEISYGTGDRFLAKIALEMGHKFLSKEFISSPQANELREFLKERNYSKRKKINVYSTSIVQARKYLGPSYEHFSIENVHTLALHVQSNKLFLFINFYGKAPAAIEVTNLKEHWTNSFEKGIVFYISPFLGKIYGPIKQCEDCSNESCILDEIKLQIIELMNKLKTNSKPI